MNRAALDALKAADPEAYRKMVERQKRSAFKAHSPKQAAILNSPSRFVVVRAGRRYGKTKVAARKLVRAAMRNPDKVLWWVANTYKNVRRGYREVVRQIPPEFLSRPASPATSNDLILYLKNGTRIEFYSGTNPDAMAGEGVFFIVVDEAALQREIVWTQTIRPTLMDYGGGALLISTPRGHNWFWQLYKRGEDPKFPDYESFHATTAENPYIKASEIEEARLTLPSVIFQQEILAEFISGQAGIFRFDESAIGELDMVHPGDQVYMGVDLARTQDFTVITASRLEDRRPVYHDRFNDLSWETQYGEIENAVRSLELQGAYVTIMLDSTGIGDVVFEELENRGLDVVPIKFSMEWKNKAVKRLSSDLEHGRAWLIEEQVPEFEAYEYKITPSGNFTYQAPEGGHDDEVSAKLLEHWGIVYEALEEGIRTLDVGPGSRDAEEEARTLGTAPTLEIVQPRTTEDLLNDPAVWH